MSQLKYQDGDRFILDAANQAIVADAVAPPAALLAWQSPAKLPGIVGGSESLAQEAITCTCTFFAAKNKE